MIIYILIKYYYYYIYSSSCILYIYNICVYCSIGPTLAPALFLRILLSPGRLWPSLQQKEICRQSAPRSGLDWRRFLALEWLVAANGFFANVIQFIWFNIVLSYVNSFVLYFLLFLKILFVLFICCIAMLSLVFNLIRSRSAFSCVEWISCTSDILVLQFDLFEPALRHTSLFTILTIWWKWRQVT